MGRLTHGEVPYHEISEERLRQLEDPQRLNRGTPPTPQKIAGIVAKLEAEKQQKALKRAMLVKLAGHLLTLKAHKERDMEKLAQDALAVEGTPFIIGGDGSDAEELTVAA